MRRSPRAVGLRDVDAEAGEGDAFAPCVVVGLHGGLDGGWNGRKSFLREGEEEDG